MKKYIQKIENVIKTIIDKYFEFLMFNIIGRIIGIIAVIFVILQFFGYI